MTQDEALAILKTGANVFLTGEPGSGKTHTVNAYVAYLRSCGIEPAITASTGIAATHVGGMTIHSWSGIGVKNTLTEQDIDAIAQKEKVVRRVSNAYVLIIDEISMLSADTLASVEAVCRSLRHNPQPFGGLQVVVVGDFFQLPPIERGNFGKNLATSVQFAFRARAWRLANFIPCYLSEQHRQEDAEFLEVLSAIRRGTVDEEVHRRLMARQKEPAKNDVSTKLFPHNASVDKLNETELKKITGIGRTYLMQSSGAPMLIEGLKRNCLSPETLVLKVGAKVMFTKNDMEGRYVNGTMGEIFGFSPVGNPVVKMRNGRTIDAEVDEWPIQDGARILAKITQIPLRLAWAITVHKSQGMSLDSAVIDLRTAFEYGQGYVALSRVRTLAGLFLLGFNARALEVHPEVSEQDVHFRDASKEAQSAFASMDDVELATFQSNFIRACGGAVGKDRIDRGSSGGSVKKTGSTYDITLEMVMEKMSIEEMAKGRKITVGTILSHLEKLALEKKIDVHADLAHIEIDPDRFMEMKKALEAVYKKEGSMPLAMARDLLDETYSYEELRLARLFL